MAPKTAKAKKANEAGEAIKKGRGKAKNEVEPEIEDIDEKIVPIVEKKKRGKKATNDTGNGVEGNGKAEDSAPPAKRGRKKAIEEPKLTAEDENPESNEEISADDASANAEDNESVDTNGDTEPLKAPSSRGRKKQPKKEAVEKVQAKPGRGKKGKQEPEEEEEEVEEKPKTAGRGRGRKPLPKAQDSEPIEEEEKELPKPKGRGRKKAPVKVTKEKTPESDQEAEEIDDDDDETIEDIKKKEAKGKKPAKKEVKEDVPEVDDDEEAPAKKRKANKKEEKGKGDIKDDDVADEEVPEPKPKGRRGQKKATETSPVDDDDTDSTSKRRRKPADEKAPGVKKPPAKNKASTDYEAIKFSHEAKDAKGKDWNFKIASWNVDGIRAWMGKGGLDYLKYEKPDILCLQEIKCATDKLPEELSEVPGYHAYWLCSDKDGYAGVNIYTTQLAMNVQYGLQNEELDDEGRIITAEYEQFYLINTYVPNAGRKLVTLSKRLQWNEEFRKFVKELDKKKPVIICGDMNVSHKEIDLANPKNNRKNAGFTDEERAGMTDLLGDGFVDTFRHLYPEKTGAYTFWTYMMNCRAKNVGWRLDYFIVSERLLPAVCDSIIRDQVYGSDHCPISLFLHLNGADKPKESLE